MKTIPAKDYFDRAKRPAPHKAGRFLTIATIVNELYTMAQYDNQLRIIQKKRMSWPQDQKKLLP
jgi:hypothetical protein